MQKQISSLQPLPAPSLQHDSALQDGGGRNEAFRIRLYGSLNRRRSGSSAESPALPKYRRPSAWEPPLIVAEDLIRGTPIQHRQRGAALGDWSSSSPESARVARRDALQPLFQRDEHRLGEALAVLAATIRAR